MHAEAIDLLIRHQLPAAARGDREAYGRIVAASQNAVTAVALAITRDVSASEDIAQEAFLSAWQKLRTLQNPASFLPWLRQITRNLARDHLRAARQRPLDGDTAELAIAHAADPDATPMQRLIDGERERAAAELISALPDDSREVLLLFYREGQSSRQVATLLGLSDAAVRKRLSRARQSVREDLLKRFAEFARTTAPGVAFTAVVGSALMSASPAAAASVTLSLGGGVAGHGLAKLGLGTLSGMAVAVVAPIAAMFFAARYLLRFATNDGERRAIRRFVLLQSAAALVGGLLLIATTRYSEGWLPMTLAALFVFVVINYQSLIQLPKIMAPCFAREAARDPVKAARDRRAFTWLYGWIGAILGNTIGLGALLYSLIASGRL